MNDFAELQITRGQYAVEYESAAQRLHATQVELNRCIAVAFITVLPSALVEYDMMAFLPRGMWAALGFKDALADAGLRGFFDKDIDIMPMLDESLAKNGFDDLLIYRLKLNALRTLLQSLQLE